MKIKPTPFFAFLISSLLVASLGYAATPTEGTISGQVRDEESNLPLSGIVVVASGPEGDMAGTTDGEGRYALHGLPIGNYTVRFHRKEVSIERSASVSVDKVVRVNVALPALMQSTEVITSAESAPMLDLGSSRVGSTLGRDFIENVPNPGGDLASLIQKSPGAYADPVGLSLVGGTGADNAYYLEGLNVTALRDGILGTNLRSVFLEEVEVMGSGFGAEYGRALGGVVNMALKSGSNEWHGSVSSWVEPGFLSVKPDLIHSDATVLSGRVERDYQTEFVAEVGGPILKDRLFVWVGYAPQVNRSHYFRSIDRFTDEDGDGEMDRHADGSPVTLPLGSQRIAGTSDTHNYAGKLTYRWSGDHALHLSLVGIDSEERYLRDANMDLVSGMTHEQTGRHDLIARWQSVFFDRHFRIDATLGLHQERYKRRAGNAASENSNDVTWYSGASLGQIDPALAASCPVDPATGATNCPVDGYQSGGYGVLRDVQAYRLAGQLKGTFIFSWMGIHELKSGIDYEVNSYDDKRWVSGVDGERGSVLIFSNASYVNTLFRLPSEKTLSAYPDLAVLIESPIYQDAIRAKTHAYNLGAFLQNSYMPFPELAVNLGVRWEAQRLTDYQNQTALTIADSFAPRVGVIFDPGKKGRAKIFTHYGQYYESIPMDLSNRAFGGEGATASKYAPDCDAATSWRACTLLETFPGSGERLYLQPNIKGSFNHEFLIGGQIHLLTDLALGVNVIYRTLGRIIEDTGGTAADGGKTPVLANPGVLWGTSLAELERQAEEAEAAAQNTNASLAILSEAARLRGLVNAAKMPKPERTYKAVQFTLSKRFSNHWFFVGSYTYARTKGNYMGLYSADSDQLDPNLSTQFDVTELMQNRNGNLPNDRPHVVRADGYYQLQLGEHSITSGLGFSGRSGSPITPLGRDVDMGSKEVFILPRGSAGRTPFVTQVDFHLAYRAQLRAPFQIECFVDIFNLFDRRTPLTIDAEYTFDTVAPTTAGTPLSALPVLENHNQPTYDADGKPVFASKNPNYLRPTSYQAPISGRIGLRVRF